ncbi:ATP-NAD kinase-like domain-containing protein [Zychaea mexicana]|uniref:ATP-NAD kinase-like domain-containing protein n=1 Tax=Zychaea mexicana TaxID=64656 RepID=UPI0022FE16C4|nr:ATP-NAD kinase-like domain-containing protein [Zychaea mexicana]KAI9493022.1 ATP-NAD kinase-like domain-containing protein [Zychaea mexicana]
MSNNETQIPAELPPVVHQRGPGSVPNVSPNPLSQQQQHHTSSQHSQQQDPCKTSAATTTAPSGAQTSERLSDTAGAVREVSKKIGRTRIKWDNPKSVMILTKPGDLSLIGMTRELALWLIKTPRYGQPSGLTVYVDEKIKNARGFRYNKIMQRYPEYQDKLRFWNPELCALQPKLFDFIVTLGGDGTVLFTSWLFQAYVPPVIPFHLGSLGFLTPFEFENYDKYLTHAMQHGVRINLRGRLTCTVYRRVPHPDCKTPEQARTIQLRNVKRNPVTGKITVGGWCRETKKSRRKKFGEVDGEDLDDEDESGAVNGGGGGGGNEMDWGDDDDMMEQRQIPCFTTVPVEKYQVINDLVVDRGPSPYVSLLELFGDDKHLTTVQADGLAISTPTGSTAYSLSAGGSLTHPAIHALLITPICPHTLSFRPTLVPDSMELRICVPYNSRNTAWASFDGRGRVELKQGDHIKVTASKYPFPTVCKEDQATDWFNSLSNCLHWNRRQRQKSFAVVESNNRNGRRSASSTPGRSNSSVSRRPSGTGMSRSMMMTSIASPSSTSTNNTTGGGSPTSPTASSGSSRKYKHSPSSDALHDEVFGMFCDDDYDSDARGNAGGTSSSNNNNAAEVDSSSMSSCSLDNFSDETDSDDENSTDKGFSGWGDEEILKGRYNASIAKELERLSTKE